MTKSIRILVFEDNQDLRETLSLVFSGVSDFNFLGAYENPIHCEELVKENKPDVVLMDIQMPGINGIDALKKIKSAFPEIAVLMLTVFEDNQRLFSALEAGANGYLLKTASPFEIMDACRQVMQGGAPMTASIARKVIDFFHGDRLKQQPDTYQLTPKENEVLQSLVKGMSYKMIADTLHISLDTVRTHIRKIYDKLHVHSSTEAVSKAIREKLVH